VVPGVVREMPPSRADGVCTTGHPMGADTSSDKLRRCARCTKCGAKGATLQQPGWMGEQIGFAPWPAPKVDQSKMPHA